MYIIYSWCRFKFMALSLRMIGTSNDERDPEYVPRQQHPYTSCTSHSGYPRWWCPA